MFSYHDDLRLPCYGIDMDHNSSEDQAEIPAAKRRRNRPSRYIRAQERRDAQKRADQRFYNVIFSLVGVCVLVVLGLAALASNGALQGETSSSEAPDVARQTFIGLTLIEWVGLLVVAIIGIFMWRRLTRR